jgi:adenosylmethionine-8-amino-7-oxononanoate aminotransferase
LTDKHAFWHPFADMSAVISGGELVLARGQGVRVFDESGTSYLDATAGLWFANVGHGRAELADAAAAQMRELAAYSTFGSYVNRPALELADRVAALAPLDGAGVFFTSGGSDAVDTAAKIARRFWQVAGQPQRTLIVGRTDAYHGMHAYGTSLAGIAANAEGWGTLVPDVRHVPRDDTAALAALLDREGGRVAAVIGEPVIGAGGIYPPREGYWKRVRALCDQYGVLLIADEVITGFGRLGHWFASERYDVQPDLITAAKGITSGYLPLGTVLCNDRIRDALWSKEAGVFRHGYTYSGHAAACAVALRNLDILEDEDLLAHVRELEPVLAAAAAGLAGAPLVGQTRSAGLLTAVELDAEARAAQPGLIDLLIAQLREEGVLSRALVGHSLQISPAFVITEAEIEELFTKIERALTALAKTTATARS